MDIQETETIENMEESKSGKVEANEASVDFEESDLDTATIGQEIYPIGEKKRKMKQARKLLRMQYKLEMMGNDYLFLQEENNHLKLEARFWKNKVSEIVQIQKTYFLEAIADHEFDKKFQNSQLIRQKSKENRKRVKSSLDKSLKLLKTKEIEKIAKKQKV